MSENRDKTPGHRVKLPGHKPASKPTVLVVDDDAPVLRLTSRYLSMSGFSVLTAESGSQAIPIWQKHKDSIDLLLTDLVMPGGINGLELAARLEAESPGLRTLLTSGYDTGLASRDGELPQGRRFLQKPYLPKQLLAAVHATIAGTPDPILSVC